MTQPKALFLSDVLENKAINDTGTALELAAAAELRRLHAENETLKKTLAASCDEERQQMWEASPGGGCSRSLSAEFQRDALLEVLKAIVAMWDHHCYAHGDGTPSPLHVKARAAIAKAEEKS